MLLKLFYSLFTWWHIIFQLSYLHCMCFVQSFNAIFQLIYLLLQLHYFSLILLSFLCINRTSRFNFNWCWRFLIRNLLSLFLKILYLSLELRINSLQVLNLLLKLQLLSCNLLIIHLRRLLCLHAINSLVQLFNLVLQIQLLLSKLLLQILSLCVQLLLGTILLLL